MRKLTKKQKSIVRYLIKNPGATVGEIVSHVGGISEQGVRDCLNKLRKEGTVRSVPTKSGKGHPLSLWYANGGMIKYAEQLGDEKEETVETEAAVPTPAVTVKTDIVSSAERKRELLKSLTPRELMQELHSRGYSGKLSFVQIVDLDRL